MIIFLYGPDTFRSKEKLKSLKNRFIREIDKSGLNLVELMAEKITINDFNKAVASQSFLAKKRMVVVQNIFKTRKNFQTEVLELLKKIKIRQATTESEVDHANSSAVGRAGQAKSSAVGRAGHANSSAVGRAGDNLLIFWDEQPDKRSALFKYLAASKFKEEFNVLTNNDLVKWIQKRFSDRVGKINRQNANFLGSKSDGNLWMLAGEIDKLIARQKGKEVKREDIEESPLVKIDDNIFNLTDAIANQDKRLALKLINDQLEAGVNEIYLLSMIVRQFRILIQIRAVLDKGTQVNYRAIANELGLHPFVVQKAMLQVKKYSLDDLKKIYNKLLEIDVKLKTSDVSAKILLEMFVIEI